HTLQSFTNFFMNMPFVNIRISKGKKTLHRWYIHPIPYEMSVKDFFIKLVNKELFPECNIALANSEEIERVELNETPTAIATQVSPSCNIVKLTKRTLNGFTILMQNARKSQLYFPIFSQSNKIN
ncbi:18968_t:CDS:2, partial [Rhizophagus irregularis]